MKNESHTTSSTQNPQNVELIQEMINCALACEACTTACLGEEDVAMLARCIELNRDCTDICSSASRFILRESEVVSQYLALAEEICQLCAEECKKHNHDHCRTCAEACFSCAEACRAYHGNIG